MAPGIPEVRAVRARIALEGVRARALGCWLSSPASLALFNRRKGLAGTGPTSAEGATQGSVLRLRAQGCKRNQKKESSRTSPYHSQVTRTPLRVRQLPEPPAEAETGEVARRVSHLPVLCPRPVGDLSLGGTQRQTFVRRVSKRLLSKESFTATCSPQKQSQHHVLLATY